MVGHSFIFYYFILTYKKLTPQLWNLLCQYNNIYASSYKYLKEKKSTNGRLKKKKKKSSIVATVPLEQTKSTVTFTHSQIHLASATTFS